MSIISKLPKIKYLHQIGELINLKTFRDVKIGEKLIIIRLNSNLFCKGIKQIHEFHFNYLSNSPEFTHYIF